MKLTRETLAPMLARLARAGLLPEDGATSVFLRDGRRMRQLSVFCRGDEVMVRTGRLPFARPLMFSRAALARI